MLEKPVTFVSKRRELRVIVKPADRQFDESRRPIIIPGERVEFYGYKFATKDENLVKWLKQHPLYGQSFVSDEPNVVTHKEEVPPAPAATQETKPFETPITKEEINVMIETKLDSFLNKVAGMMQQQASAREPSAAPKKTFKCPHCEEVFKSGIEVGKHKKLVHPDPNV